jgi:uncharacterized membrane-anchored protein
MAARTSVFIGMAAVVLVALVSSAWAQAPTGAELAERLQSAVDAMQKVLKRGPADIPLGDQGRFHVPENTGFVRQPEAGAWAEVSGYEADKDMVGMVTPMAEGTNWVAFIDYHAAGHVSDEDAKGWSADELLQSLKASTEAGNADRQKRDLPQLTVSGWLVPPAYDADTHKLIWAANTPHKGDNEGDDEGSANIHGFVLGKDGYFEMTLVAPAGEVAGYEATAAGILSGLAFNAGSRYSDQTTGSGGKSITALVSTAAPGLLAKITGILATPWPWLAIGFCFVIVGIFGMRRSVRG